MELAEAEVRPLGFQVWKQARHQELEVEPEITRWRVYPFAITKYHKLGDLNDRNVSCHSFDG